MGKRTIISLAAAAFLCFGVAGCAASAGSDAPSPVGSWGSQNDGQPNLEFVDDGTVHGTDGCNQLVGSWTQDGATVMMPELASTMMFCEGVDDWLNGATSATISGSTLTVEGEDGTAIGTLERAGE